MSGANDQLQPGIGQIFGGPALKRPLPQDNLEIVLLRTQLELEFLSALKKQKDLFQAQEALLKLDQASERPRADRVEPGDCPRAAAARQHPNVGRTRNGTVPINMLGGQIAGVIESVRILVVARRANLSGNLDSLPVSNSAQTFCLIDHDRDARRRLGSQFQCELLTLRREHGRVDDAAVEQHGFRIVGVQARNPVLPVYDLRCDPGQCGRSADDREAHAPSVSKKKCSRDTQDSGAGSRC